MQRYMRGMSYGSGIQSREPIDNETLQRFVPSIFASEAHESRSQKYAYIPTITVLDGLRNEGFKPYFAQQAKSRIAGKSEFTKHMLRLRHDSRTNDRDEAHEIILINAHDGTSSYQMINGVFRFVCANGLFTGDTFGETKVSHRGDAVSKVIEGAYEVLDNADNVMGAIENMKSLTLSEDEQRAFATAALQLRYDDPEKPAPIDSERLLRPRRSDDQGSDLWRTFNTTQENLIRGGQRGVTRDTRNNLRRTTVREVKGIDQKKSLNRALWTLSEEMQRIKAAA